MSVNHPRELLRPDGSLPQLFLPSPPSCPSVDDVRKYTLSIMAILGLKQYDVRWSSARQEAGHCLQNSHVALTRPHIDCCLKRKDDPAIWKVVLHEIAHALEYELFGNGGHGSSWILCCKALGLYGGYHAPLQAVPPHPSVEFVLNTMLESYYGKC